jgi:hypothetical protein
VSRVHNAFMLSPLGIVPLIDPSVWLQDTTVLRFVINAKRLNKFLQVIRLAHRARCRKPVNRTSTH